MPARDGRPPLKEVPEIIYDKTGKKRYMRGRFLGKGGFARCYELTEYQTRRICAGKVVAKSLLKGKSQKDKMAQEVAIHRSLSHPHIVKLEGCFEDEDNVYVMLELCSRRSLMELNKRRRAITEPEARYFLRQIVQACEYLHQHLIIHRDLKLGNLFLDEQMQLKVGDFGLATQLSHDDEKKKTLCGTPNYIAPEMLNKQGHSLEVDVWAIGCILFTLLVGKPPFETDTLQKTYDRIKSNRYFMPDHVGKEAAALIQDLLAPIPSERPRVGEILSYPFFSAGPLPRGLPTSCLTMAPKSNMLGLEGDGTPIATPPRRRMATPKPMESPIPPAPRAPTASIPMDVKTERDRDGASNDYHLSELEHQLVQLLDSHVTFDENDLMDIQDPASSPIYWVAKWLDYSDKYGFGYTLCDGSMGVYFNDYTKLISDANRQNLEYVDADNFEYYYSEGNVPSELAKKAGLLNYFRGFMSDKLVDAGLNIPQREGDEFTRLPCLDMWFRTKSAILLHLSNGTIQLNFFHDHSKLILCPLMGAVTYINEKENAATFKFELMSSLGCPREIRSRLSYAKGVIGKAKGRIGNGAGQGGVRLRGM